MTNELTRLMPDLLGLAALAVFIVDVSGWTESWKAALARFTRRERVGRLRPFDCSLCTAWWAGIAYLLATHQFSIAGCCAAALAAASTPLLLAAWVFARTLVAGLLDWLTLTTERLFYGNAQKRP